MLVGHMPPAIYCCNGSGGPNDTNGRVVFPFKRTREERKMKNNETRKKAPMCLCLWLKGIAPLKILHIINDRDQTNGGLYISQCSNISSRLPLP
jgi:hypothetical protein